MDDDSYSNNRFTFNESDKSSSFISYVTQNNKISFGSELNRLTNRWMKNKLKEILELNYGLL